MKFPSNALRGTGLILSVVVAYFSGEASARSEAPNDHEIVLADASVDPPPVTAHNVAEANATFNRRATRLLRYAACANNDIANTEFWQNFENWGNNALAKLAYTGDCPSQTKADRWKEVSAALEKIIVPEYVMLGTDIDDGPLGVSRNGDLDTGFKELIPILYKFRDRIDPAAFNHVFSILQQRISGSDPVLSSCVDKGDRIICDQPFVRGTGFIFNGRFRLFIPETENHALLELSTQYLTNQLINRVSSATIDNRFVREYLRYYLHGILSRDFFEYNARPYTRFSLNAMDNLVNFAEDDDIRQMARMVLDYSAAKFAVSSSLLRRSSPFRRRGSEDGDLYSGDSADEQVCRFYLYSGLLDTLSLDQNLGSKDPTRVYAAPSFCAHVAHEAIGSYRVPDAILGLVFPQEISYLQIFSGKMSYLPPLFQEEVRGTTEVYNHESTFLIAAGGLPQAHGLPLIVDGDVPDILFDIGQFFSDSASAKHYSVSESDVGVSISTVLIPNDSKGFVPIVDRKDLVRVQGTGHRGSNMCVGYGFACGKNPVIPERLRTPGPTYAQVGPPHDGCPATWQFVVIQSAPVDTYVAMFCQQAYRVPGSQNVADHESYTIGLFEAERADKFSSFVDFQNRVQQNNLGLIIAESVTALSDSWRQRFDFYECSFNQFCPQVVAWKGQYTKTDGSIYRFLIPADFAFNSSFRFSNPIGFPVPFAVYPVEGVNVVSLPPLDPMTWPLADLGPVRATSNGFIQIDNPVTHERCTLDAQNAMEPRINGDLRKACPVSCAPTCGEGFECGTNDDCASKVCANGKCQAPSCAPSCKAGDACGSDQDCGTAPCIGGVCQPDGSNGSVCRDNNACDSQKCFATGQGIFQLQLCRSPDCSPACSNRQHCGADSDCSSGLCIDGACGEPSCAPNCDLGLRCGQNNDCASKVCAKSGVCVSDPQQRKP